MSDPSVPPSDRRPGTLITARRVITDPERPPLERGGVLLRDGVVAAVGPAPELEESAGPVDHLEFPMGTVIPGLINAHVHLAFDVTTDPRTALEAGDLDAVRATIAVNARAALDGGVTTARDLGDPAGLVAAFGERVASGSVAGPRVLSAMSPLTPPGGHCRFLGGEIDTSGGEADPVIRAAVDARADAGADLIKVMASGGNLTPAGAPMWQSQFGERDLVDTMTLFEAAGWSRPQALATATTRAASALGRADDIGRLDVGHSADLVVLDADPLVDLRALKSVRLVVVRGRQHIPTTS